MKKLILSTLFISLISITAFSQIKVDSILISIDTINVYGKVIDLNGDPVTGADVLSQTFDKEYKYMRTKTNKNGVFYLNGISPKDVIRVRKDDINVEERLNSSRYVLINMVPLQKHELNKNKEEINVTAERISPKTKYKYKTKDTLIVYSFDEFGLYSPATYPGGVIMLYKQIKNSITYPKKAIENNVEGIVAIEFTIDKWGNCGNFTTIKDIGYGCASQLINIIKKLKKWHPAMNGLNVSQRVYLEIPFKLVD